ncbi:MAG: multiheme c-type cytochrome, partial [Rhodothermales bacterium]
MRQRFSSASRESEWRRKSLHVVAALLVFETLTGLAIWLLPFSVSNQVTVLVHTIVGVVFLVPYGWYQLRHWLVYRSRPLNHVKLTGYLGMAATSVALVSGGVLTAQALFGTRISYVWDTVHLVSTFAVVASALPHVLLIVYRDVRARAVEAMKAVVAAERTFAINVTYLTVLLFGVIALGVYAYQPVQLQTELPDDYNYLYGAERPFAPSLATTGTGEAIDARALGNSASCGRSGCHVEIVEEWEVSAHRWAASDPAFRAIQTVMGEQNGPESTRYCGGCHDPISLFSGSKNLFREELTNPLGLDEGVSCVACHAITETDVQGNANYTIAPPERYIFELHDREELKLVSDFLIRAYPEQHVESLQHRRFKSPEFCAACHKQFIDEEINKVGWVQLQNQYDNWRQSHWNTPDDATKTIECRECHMPLANSTDPAAGDRSDYNRFVDDNMHRSHRFLGSNQFMPKLLNLPGADKQTEFTEQWLQGKYDI